MHKLITLVTHDLDKPDPYISRHLRVGYTRLQLCWKVES